MYWITKQGDCLPFGSHYEQFKARGKHAVFVVPALSCHAHALMNERTLERICMYCNANLNVLVHSV